MIIIMKQIILCIFCFIIIYIYIIKNNRSEHIYHLEFSNELEEKKFSLLTHKWISVTGFILTGNYLLFY